MMEQTKLVEALEEAYLLTYRGVEQSAARELTAYQDEQKRLRDSAIHKAKTVYASRMSVAEGVRDNRLRRTVLTQLRAQLDNELS